MNFDYFCQNDLSQTMESFGDKIRKLREAEKQPLRIVAAYLNVDQAILSKFETGSRTPSRDQVRKLAKYFNSSEKELILAWLSDILFSEVSDEDEKIATHALQLAEEKVAFYSAKRQRKRKN